MGVSCGRQEGEERLVLMSSEVVRFMGSVGVMSREKERCQGNGSQEKG